MKTKTKTIITFNRRELQLLQIFAQYTLSNPIDAHLSDWQKEKGKELHEGIKRILEH